MWISDYGVWTGTAMGEEWVCEGKLICELST